MDQITEGLLVAFMFILILSMGVGTILVAAADLADRRRKLRVHWLPLSWLVILLLVQLSLFWNTLDILLVEDWSFFDFILVTAGPVILYLATGVLLPDPETTDAEGSLARYFQVSRIAFPLLMLLALWSLGTQYGLLGGTLQSPLWEAGDITVLLVLSLSRSTGVHGVCTALYAALLLGYYLPVSAA